MKELTKIHLLMERTDLHYVATELVKWYSNKLPAGVKVKNTSYKLDSLKGDYDVDRNLIRIRRSGYKNVDDFITTVLHEIKHAMDAKDKGKNNYKADYEWEMNYQIQNNKHQYDDNKYEIEAEKWAREEYRKRWKGKF